MQLRKIFLPAFLFPFLSFGQQIADSTIQELPPIYIKSYFSAQPLLGLTSSAKVIDHKQIESQAPGNLVSVMNTTPGLRVEERSPGSYRIALRGSMIRSPFGVRNTKVYIDEIPMTDAGGNTYFNILDPVGMNNISILKGPDGALFGPNSGGIIRIMPNGFDNLSPATSLLLSGGSFGTFNQQLQHRQKVSDKYQFSIDQAFTRADGYREQTFLNKKFFQTAHQWQYHPKTTLKLYGLYSDLDYGTPGGLTQEQYDENPKQARPSTPAIAGSVEQNASIRNKTTLVGMTHEYRFADKWKHSATLFGSYTDFTNPFVNKYENRYERNAGLRTFVSYENHDAECIQWEMQAGLEIQHGRFKSLEYKNNQGVAGDLNLRWNIQNTQQSYFYRAMLRFNEKLTLEGSLGLNRNTMDLDQDFPLSEQFKGSLGLGDTWMPRIAGSYLFTPNMALRASISKGFSPPTVEEVRNSQNKLNNALKPEQGTNYELGYRVETSNRRWIADVSYYFYQLHDGIVRQLDDEDVEYFVNAGKIKQQGLELLIMVNLIRSGESDHFVRSLQVWTNLTYQDYVFDQYQMDDNDFSGNKVTSIPEWIWANTVQINFPANVGINLLHNYTSDIPLNDANTVYADKYHLLQAKVHWTTHIDRRWAFEIFVGGDNLLDQKYSLGNDINALGNRFFNPAPSRNFYGGIKVSF